MSRSFYSVPDVASVRESPQPLQHLAIAAMAKQLAGEIVFYTMEDHYTVRTHEIVLAKVAERPPVDGIIFFRLRQFVADGSVNFAVLRTILAHGYTVAFARERLAIAGVAELDALFPFLSTFALVDARDRDRAFVREALPVVEAALAGRYDR